MPELSFRPLRSEGPVGTGVHLLRVTQGDGGLVLADSWLTILFLPVVPLGKWTIEHRGTAPSVITRVSPPRPIESALWIAGGAVAALLSLVPAYGAVTFLMGAKIAEVTGVFASVGAILGPLGWLDETRDRVPLRVALRALASATLSVASD